MPRGRKAPKLWPAEPVKRDGDRVVGQAVAAVATGELGAEHGADRAVDVADRRCDSSTRSPRSSAGAHCSISALVERLVEAVVLPDHLVQVGALGQRRAGAGSG